MAQPRPRDGVCSGAFVTSSFLLAVDRDFRFEHRHLVSSRPGWLRKVGVFAYSGGSRSLEQSSATRTDDLPIINQFVARGLQSRRKDFDLF